MAEHHHLTELARLIRYYILLSTTAAGSGHPSSSLSAVELLTALFFQGFFRANLDEPQFPNNDRFILSKGHAAPLLYSVYAAAGRVDEAELKTLRQFGSRLQGHPTPDFEYAEIATGSLGQGLSVGVGMALNARYLDELPYRTWVLLGDSELAEGSNWEAIQLAAHYRLGNLIGILDVNRLGQRGQTMAGHDLESYQQKLAAFGWRTIIIDGHNFDEIIAAYDAVTQPERQTPDQPTMIIAKTIKGQGVSLMADHDGWHGKALSEEQFSQALKELGPANRGLLGEIAKPELELPRPTTIGPMTELDKTYDEPVAVRTAYGHALVELAQQYPEIIVLDAEVSNSTFSAEFKNYYPDRFFEMFIAEQNMVGVALGLARRGKIPFVSTFGAFFTRAFDQIRVAQYSQANINFVGSHVGVSIGEDGPTQMGLEDIALFRAIHGSVVVYPADHVAAEQLTQALCEHQGICYLRSTRATTEPIYQPTTSFKIGGSHTLRHSKNDQLTIISAGITLYEALEAARQLADQDIQVRVIDAYSIKPLDEDAIITAAAETGAILTVEDHFPAGGLGEAVAAVLAAHHPTPLISLAVHKLPSSGKPAQLLAYQEIDSTAIVKKVAELIRFKKAAHDQKSL